MIKNKELNRLFTDWKKKYPRPEQFHADGIINEYFFEKAPIKILFLNKEPNNPNGNAWDYREWYNTEKARHQFSYRLTEWAFGIVNNFPPIEEVWKDEERAHDMLRSVAIMNVKKSGGIGRSVKLDLTQHAREHYTYIKNQIDIIQPDLIILGLSWKNLRNIVFPGVHWQHSGYNLAVGEYNGAKVIDFYHPSSRNAPQAVYCLLEKVIAAIPFDPNKKTPHF